MTSLPRQFREDKALRDAAKAVLEADIAHFKDSMAEHGLGGRITSQITGKVKRRISGGAQDILEQAKEQASDHRGVLAVLIGAVVLWFAREPVFGWLGVGETDEDEGDEDEDYEGDDYEGEDED
jgi:hypothetical protein